MPGRIDDKACDCSGIDGANGVDERCGFALAVEGEVVAGVQDSCGLSVNGWVCVVESRCDGGALGAVFKVFAVLEVECAVAGCQKGVHSVADFCWDFEERCACLSRNDRHGGLECLLLMPQRSGIVNDAVQ